MRGTGAMFVMPDSLRLVRPVSMTPAPFRPLRSASSGASCNPSLLTAAVPWRRSSCPGGREIAPARVDRLIEFLAQEAGAAAEAKAAAEAVAAAGAAQHQLLLRRRSLWRELVRS